jgi:hypothetical protein
MRSYLDLRESYSILIILAVILSVLSLILFIYKVEWLSGYISNTATGIIASLIIIFFIDKIIDRNKEKERLRIVKIALPRLRFPIIWQMMLLCNIYKAAAQSKPSHLPTTFEETFTGDYYKEISFLDFSKEAPVAIKMDWFNYLNSEIKLFKEKLEQVTDTYSGFLDASLIDLLEKIIGSHFLLFLPHACMIPQVDRQYGVKRIYTVLNGAEKIVKEYVSLMLELIEYYNSNCETPILLSVGIWNDITAPKWGSSRAT